MTATSIRNSRHGTNLLNHAHSKLTACVLSVVPVIFKETETLHCTTALSTIQVKWFSAMFIDTD